MPRPSSATCKIDKTGIVSARYSNGQTKVIGEVVLPAFASIQQGLQPIGNNRWMGKPTTRATRP